MPAIAQPPPPMWNSGIATRFTESGRSSTRLADRQRRKKLRVREHHALGPAGRARRVQLERDVVGAWPARPGRRHRGGAIQSSYDSCRDRVADHDDLRDRRQVAGDRVEHRHEVGPDDEHLGLRVVDDVLDLGRREAPVHVDADRVQQRGAVEDLEVLDAVLVEERDAVLAARRPRRPARSATWLDRSYSSP